MLAARKWTRSIEHVKWAAFYFTHFFRLFVSSSLRSYLQMKQKEEREKKPEAIKFEYVEFGFGKATIADVVFLTFVCRSSVHDEKFPLISHHCEWERKTNTSAAKFKLNDMLISK